MEQEEKSVDQAAGRVNFGEQILTHYTDLTKFALRLTGNKAQAADLVHDTVVRALEKAHLYQDRGNLLGWLGSIQYNLFVSRWRRKVKFETQYDPDSFIQKEVIAPVQDVKVEAQQLLRQIARLPHHMREVLTLLATGHKYEEVAAILGIPVGTVRSRVARARALLTDRPYKRVTAPKAVPGTFISAYWLIYQWRKVV